MSDPFRHLTPFSQRWLSPRWICLLLCVLLPLLSGCERKGEKDDDKPKTAEQHPTTAKAKDADEVSLSADAIKKYGVKTERVGKHPLHPVFTAPARVAFNTEAMARVGTPVPGRVVELKVKLGDAVQKDAELLVIESQELGEAQSDYLQKRTLVSASTVAIEPARNAYERGKALHEKDEGVSLAEVQKREGEYRAAEAALRTAQAAFTAAQEKLQLLGMNQGPIEDLARTGKLNPRYAVRAPIAGTIIQRDITPGQLIGPDKDAGIVLADLTSLWVLADVPEARLPKLSVGGKARVRLAALPDRPIDGTISFVSPSLDPNTRCAQVRIEIPGTEAKPGMFAEAQISESREDNAVVLAIPESAVQSIEAQAVVFAPVAGKQNTFIKRPVKLGPDVAGMLPVLAGLKEGDLIVTSGSFILKAELGKSVVDED